MQRSFPINDPADTLRNTVCFFYKREPAPDEMIFVELRVKDLILFKEKYPQYQIRAEISMKDNGEWRFITQIPYAFITTLTPKTDENIINITFSKPSIGFATRTATLSNSN